MILSRAYEYTGTEPGKELPGFAWPGGYPIIYITGDGATACADCANGKNGSDFPDPEQDSPDWTIEGADVFYEGPPEYCCHCNAAIESAYGEPDEPADTPQDPDGPHYTGSGCFDWSSKT